ncbi:alpha/beta hydrolase fold domain-containing protein [Deinococcus sp. SM5_A1]|uniref:alpha/beta hydrolase fold domain-containing protein n=1 Tax=Deinococcus sp. SM5_A1 TaxID=3379094 RepID=UPI003859A70F
MDPFPPPDLELLEDVPFSAHGLKLDILRPRIRSAKPVPAVLHLHGGAWVMYGKWPTANVFLARAGFVTVSADYRLAPHSIFPAQLHDVRAAVRWLRAHASGLGTDPQRIGAWGVSAGAHLAGLLGTAAGAELEDPDAEHSARVQAVGNVSGVMDFLDPAFHFGPQPPPLFGSALADCRERAALASPLTHAGVDSPPFLHLHGTHDDEVPVSQARRIHTALQSAGAKSELVELDGDHYINDTHRAEVEARLLAFFCRTLKHTPG